MIGFARHKYLYVCKSYIMCRTCLAFFLIATWIYDFVKNLKVEVSVTLRCKTTN